MESFFLYRRLSMFYDGFMALNFVGKKSISREMAVEKIAKCSSHVIELGVGTGLNLPFWNDYPDIKVVAVDICKEMLDHAKKKLPDSANVELVQAEGADLPFPDDAFDGALLSLFLSQMIDHERILNELERVMAPNSILVVLDSLPSKNRFARWLEKIFEPLLRPLGLTLGVNVIELAKSRGWQIMEQEKMRGMFGLLSLIKIKITS